MEESEESEESEDIVKQNEILAEFDKKTFVVKMRPTPGGGIEKAIFIGGELLDWQVDIDSLMEATKMGPKFMRAVQKDIEKHFTESVSDFIGRKVTAEDIKKAIKIGYI